MLPGRRAGALRGNRAGPWHDAHGGARGGKPRAANSGAWGASTASGGGGAEGWLWREVVGVLAGEVVDHVHLLVVLPSSFFHIAGSFL